MEQFIDDYGVYFVLVSMCFLAATMIYTSLPIKRYQPERLTVRFVCYLCKGNGEAKNDPEFECEVCNGTGIISFSTIDNCLFGSSILGSFLFSLIIHFNNICLNFRLFIEQSCKVITSPAETEQLSVLSVVFAFPLVSVPLSA